MSVPIGLKNGSNCYCAKKNHTVYSDAGALSGAMDGFFSRQACGDICLMYTKIQGSWAGFRPYFNATSFGVKLWLFGSLMDSTISFGLPLNFRTIHPKWNIKKKMSDYSLPYMASFQNLYKKLIGTQNQGCGVRVNAGVGVGQSHCFACSRSQSWSR